MLINDVLVCQKLWSDELDKPFNPVQLEYIKFRYDRAMRMNDVYSALYKEQRESYLDDLIKFNARVHKEFEGLSKKDVAKRLDYNPGTKSTRQDMIDMYIFAECGKIESDHDRVKRIWASMTDEQKEGMG